jgi:hypothetical protein
MAKTIAKHGKAEVAESFFRNFISGEKCRGLSKASSRHAIHERTSKRKRGEGLQVGSQRSKARVDFWQGAKIAIVILKYFAIVMIS